jgi:ATP-dependent DNA helicase RecG
MRQWTIQARAWLEVSRKLIPQEINELDWKRNQSDNRERLVEHLIAFANNPGGGYLVYGVANPFAELVGVKQEEVASRDGFPGD